MPTSINGVADQSFLTGDGAVALHARLASPPSRPSANSARLLQGRRPTARSAMSTSCSATRSTSRPSARSFDLGAPGNGERIGFFLIQDGFDAVRRPAGQPLLRGAGTARRQRSTVGLPRLLTQRHARRARAAPRSSIPSPPSIPNGANQVLSGVMPGGRELHDRLRGPAERHRRQGLSGRRDRHPRHRRRLPVYLRHPVNAFGTHSQTRRWVKLVESHQAPHTRGSAMAMVHRQRRNFHLYRLTKGALYGGPLDPAGLDPYDRRRSWAFADMMSFARIAIRHHDPLFVS